MPNVWLASSITASSLMDHVAWDRIARHAHHVWVGPAQQTSEYSWKSIQLAILVAWHWHRPEFVLSMRPAMHHPSLATGATMSVHPWKGDHHEHHRGTTIGKHDELY